MNIQEFKKEFDVRFFAYIEKKISSYKNITTDKQIQLFLKYIQTYTKEGKRVRPYCAYIAYTESNKKITDAVWSVMISLELIQTFALIHDDVIDNSSLRRGLPTVHEYIKQQSNDVASDATHYANMQAVLVGDLVYTLAFDVLCGADIKPAVRLKIQTLLEEVIVGQMLDVRLAYQKEPVAKKTIMQKMQYKTARYTFARPFEIGALLGGLSAEKQAPFFALGEALGIAYQIQDDALDIFGDEVKIKKNTFDDMREGQQTLATEYFYKKASQKDLQLFEQFFGKDFSKEEGSVLKSLLHTYAVDAYLQKEAQKFFAVAEESVSTAPYRKTTKELLVTFIDMVALRAS